MGSLKQVIQPDLPSNVTISDPMQDSHARLDRLAQRPFQYEALITELSRRKDMTPLQAQQNWPTIKDDPEITDLREKKYTREEVAKVLFPDTQYGSLADYTVRRELMEQQESDFMGYSLYDRIKPAFTPLGAKNFGKGLARSILETPTYVGNLIDQQGDVKTAVFDFFFDGDSPARRALERSTPGSALTGEELSAFGNKIIKMNQDFLRDINLQPEGSSAQKFMFNLGSGGGTAAMAIGVAYMGRPDVAAYMFGLIQEGEVYQEAREAGLDPFAASGVGIIAGSAEAALEKIGLDIWVSRLRGKGTFTRILLRSLTEGGQEVGQQSAEEIITKLSGVRDKDWPAIFASVGEAGAIGLIIGGALGGPTTLMENAGLIGELREAGLTDTEIELVGKAINKDIKEHVQKELDELVAEETGKTVKEKTDGLQIVPNGEEAVPDSPEKVYGETEAGITPELPEGSNFLEDAQAEEDISVTEDEIADAIPLEQQEKLTDEQIEELAFAEDSNSSTRMPVNLVKPDGETPTIGAHKVIKQMVKIPAVIGSILKIKTGKVSKRARGTYNPRTHTIRIKTANNIPTATHEIGHAMEDLIFPALKKVPKKEQAQMIKELKQLGFELYGPAEPHNGYASEGVAEYHRYLLTDPAQVRIKAKTFHKFFSQEILDPVNRKELFKAYQDTREAIITFQRQGAMNRAKASIFHASNVEERVAIMKDTIFNKDVFFQQHIEMLYPLKVLEQRASEELKRPLQENEKVFQKAKALRLTHTAIVEQMVDRGMVDIRGQVIGRSLKDILAPVRGRREDFTIYLWARRAIALWKDPEGARNPGMSREDAEQVLRENESPAFQLAAEQLYVWEDQVLNYVGQASPVFRKTIKEIRKRDPGNYIPLKRHFDDLSFRYAEFSSKPQAFSGSITKALKGSGRRIKEPFSQIIEDTVEKVKAAHTRMVVDTMIHLAKTVPGIGSIIEPVRKDLVPALNRPVADILNAVDKQLRKKGVFLKTSSVVSDEQAAQALMESIVFFQPAKSPKPGETIIPVLNPVNNKIEWFELDSGLFESLMSMDTFQSKQTGVMLGVWNVASGVAKTFRFGTTGVRLTFGLVTNPLRDFKTLMVNTQSHANSFTLFGAWMNQMARAAVSPFGVKLSPEIDFLIKHGVQMAQPLGQDLNITERTVRGLFQGRLTKTLDPRNWLDFIRDIVQFPESATRAAEVQVLVKEMGIDLSKPLSVEEAHRLLLAGKEVTTDFSAAGEFARMWNQIVPFYNASIQGPRANIRAAKRNPAGFFMRVLAIITLPSLLLWWRNKDEEWYQELSHEERALFWYIPVEINGQDELVRIPRAFDVGTVFGAMPEGLLQAAHEQDPAQVAEVFNAFRKSALPNVIPQAALLVAEQLRNKNFFWDTPIVSQSLDKRAAEEQFDEFTTRAAIETVNIARSVPIVGELIHVSPKRVDHLITGIFGSASRDVLSTLGLGPADLQKEKELSDLPVIGTLFQRGGVSGVRSEAVSTMYDRMAEANQVQSSPSKIETDEQRQMRLMYTDASRAVSGIFYVRSRTQKDSERRALSKLAVEIAREANEIFDSGTVSKQERRKFTKSKKKFAKQKKKLKKERQKKLRDEQ